METEIDLWLKEIDKKIKKAINADHDKNCRWARGSSLDKDDPEFRTRYCTCSVYYQVWELKKKLCQVQQYARQIDPNSALQGNRPPGLNYGITQETI